MKMACFLVPGVEAIVVTATAQILARWENKPVCPVSAGSSLPTQQTKKGAFAKKLMWLSKLLFGGSVLLAFEHLWHGEIVPWFPFLTAASDAAATAEMLHEMASVGVCMAVLVTAVWGVMALAASVLEKKAYRTQKEQ